MHDSGFSAARASAALWSFLNLNVGLQGDARTKFDQAKELHGLDVWRRIVVPIEPKTTARRVAMHTDIHGPARATLRDHRPHRAVGEGTREVLRDGRPGHP